MTDEQAEQLRMQRILAAKERRGIIQALNALNVPDAPATKPLIDDLDNRLADIADTLMMANRCLICAKGIDKLLYAHTMCIVNSC